MAFQGQVVFPLSEEGELKNSVRRRGSCNNLYQTSYVLANNIQW